MAEFNTEPASLRTKDDQDTHASEVIDPLAGMAAVDKWGLKGLRTLMNNHPDYHAMVVGMDPGSLGLDISSQEYVCSSLLLKRKSTDLAQAYFPRRTIRFLTMHPLVQHSLPESSGCLIVTT